MSDKAHTLSVTLPESLYARLKDFSFNHDSSASHVIASALTLALPLLHEHPLQLKFMEFEAVTQHFNDNGKTA